MKCPKCGHNNPDGVKFCNQCAAELASELVCPKCGQKNHQGSKFCNECAQPVVPSQTAQPKVATPTTSTTVPTSFASGRYIVKPSLKQAFSHEEQE